MHKTRYDKVHSESLSDILITLSIFTHSEGKAQATQPMYSLTLISCSWRQAYM